MRSWNRPEIYCEVRLVSHADVLLDFLNFLGKVSFIKGTHPSQEHPSYKESKNGASDSRIHGHGRFQRLPHNLEYRHHGNGQQSEEQTERDHQFRGGLEER